LENIRTHPSVAAALGREDLCLHGWVYKFETGQVFAYDSEQGQFLALHESSADPKENVGDGPSS
jgi:carbonic anhydrase